MPPPTTNIGGMQWVATFDGYPILLTSGDAAAALAVYPGHTQAIGDCLIVDQVNQQEIDPTDPFRGGGSCTVLVLPGIRETGAASDEFGRDTHRKNAGVETVLKATLNRTDATVTVLDTSAFPAAGEIYIGTECIAYTGKAATQFTGCTRGMYAAYGRDGTSPRRFAHRHGVDFYDYDVPSETLVTSQPRKWKGRRVDVSWHKRVDAGGVLDSRAVVEAAGRSGAWRISGDIADDPDSGATTVPLEHELDAIPRTTVMRDPFSAKVREGIRLLKGLQINFRDHNGTILEVASPLDVVDTTPADSTEILEGWYSAAEFCAALNAWLADQLAAANLSGTYTWSVIDTGEGVWRTTCKYEVNGTPGNQAWWELSVPTTNSGSLLVEFLGIYDQATADTTTWRLKVTGAADDPDTFASSKPPKRVAAGYDGNPGYAMLGLAASKGAFRNQKTSLPSWAAVPAGMHVLLGWGLFLVDGVTVLAAVEFEGADAIALRGIGISDTANIALPGSEDLTHQGVPGEWVTRLTRYVGDDSPPLEIFQVLAFAGPFKTIMTRFFYSTGTPGYNGVHDVFPDGVGIGIPHDLLGDAFIDSVNGLPGANVPMTLIIDKEIEVSELLEADFLLRRSHLVFDDGRLQFRCWSTPHADMAIWTLTEDNKAESISDDVTQRSSPLQSNKWAMPIVKLKFNRSLRTGAYLDERKLIVPSAIDDGGGKGGDPVTISCRNLYTDNIDDLIAEYMPWLAYFAEPIYLMRRSISPDLYHGPAPGDGALVNDNFARDTDDGERVLLDKPCLIVKHMWAPPVTLPSTNQEPATQGMRGEIEVAMLAADRLGVYSPCAEVDHNAANGGYEAVGLWLTCHPHEHSKATDVVDATRFAIGAKVRVVERDPDSAAAPQTWEDTVADQTGNTIRLTVGLAGWVATKRYMVISDAYADAVAAQRAKAYQADDADARIQDMAPPFLYGEWNHSIAFTEDANTVPSVRPANLAFTDGAPRDTGYERDHLRFLENMLDWKSAIQCPMLDLEEIVSTATGSDWQLANLFQVYLQPQNLLAGIERYLQVGPWIRSTSGLPVKARVSLCSQDYYGESLLNVVRPGLFFEQEFTTSHLTGEVADERPLSLRAVPHEQGDWSGVAYVYLEIQANCATRGLAHMAVGPREEAA